MGRNKKGLGEKHRPAKRLWKRIGVAIVETPKGIKDLIDHTKGGRKGGGGEKSFRWSSPQVFGRGTPIWGGPHLRGGKAQD